MKLSKEEFKELYALHNEAWNNFCKYSEIISESVLDELIFPLFNWIETRADIKEQETDFDIIGDLVVDGDYPIAEEVRTNDLDLIYDRYIGG